MKSLVKLGRLVVPKLYNAVLSFERFLDRVEAVTETNPISSFAWRLSPRQTENIVHAMYLLLKPSNGEIVFPEGPVAEARLKKYNFKLREIGGGLSLSCRELEKVSNTEKNLNFN